MLRFGRALFIAVALLGFSGFADAAQPQREWTMLLFLNGHNDLDVDGDLNLNQMEEIGSNEKMNLVVQWGSLRRKNDQRLLITKDNDSSQVNSKVLMTLPSVDMGDVNSLKDFLSWGAKNFPAKHYMVVVWNHGSGWHDLVARKIRIQNISYDDRTGNSITTPELGQALSEFSASIGKKIDIYGSDACLMQMAEVIGEMKDVVSYAVGSEELEPSKGWPYSTFLRRVNAEGDFSARKIATTLVEEYHKAYSTGGLYGLDQVTLSALDVSKFDALSSSLRSLVAKATKTTKLTGKLLTDIIFSSQQFYTVDYVDLGDFLKRLQEKVPSLKSEITDAQQKLSATVIANKTTSPYEKATGLSIWLPDSSSTFDQYVKDYRDLQFAADSNWLDLLDLLK